MQVTGNKQIRSYKLSIRVTADGFSLYIYNVGKDGTPLHVEEVRPQQGELPHQALQRALTRPRNMEFNFDEVVLLADTPCTLMPMDEFRKQEALTLYRLNFPGSQWQASEIHYDVLPQMEVVVLYALENKTLQTVSNIFPEVKTRNATGLWLERIAEKNRVENDKESHFYACIRERQMAVGILQGERLHFACTYPATNDPDRLYYLMAVWKQTEMDGEKHSCTLQGASDVLTSNIRKYVRDIRTAELTD